MSRVLKFRAWDPKGGVMAERLKLGWDHVPDLNGSFELMQRHAVLMQFTGLMDEKGKEIYEGDIWGKRSLKGTIYSTRVVEWSNSEAGWLPFSQPADGGYEWDAERPGEGEVIGNIYENPDLLK